MRILAIRGKNLASLAEPFEILLNAGPLEQAGLFAITGQTGAGKSTILDALCLALYDEIPRLPSGQGFAIGHKDEDEKLRVTSNDVRSILRRHRQRVRRSGFYRQGQASLPGALGGQQSPRQSGRSLAGAGSHAKQN